MTMTISGPSARASALDEDFADHLPPSCTALRCRCSPVPPRRIGGQHGGLPASRPLRRQPRRGPRDRYRHLDEIELKARRPRVLHCRGVRPGSHRSHLPTLSRQLGEGAGQPAIDQHLDVVHRRCRGRRGTHPQRIVGEWRLVSQRSTVRSIPPTKAIASSMQTIF